MFVVEKMDNVVRDHKEVGGCLFLASDRPNIISEGMGALELHERSVTRNSWSKTIKIHLPRMVLESTKNVIRVEFLVEGCEIFC